MIKRGKKYKKASQQVNKRQALDVSLALAKVKELAFAQFDESVDVSVNLGINPTRGDQVVRGSVLLPHGTGKKVRVIVFAKGDHAQEAQDAGADYVGADDLIKKIQDGWMDFDYAVATPDMMGAVGKLAKVLGPRGLLPNKKVGTVTFDVGPVVRDLKKGRSFFKNDKQGVVHFSFGKVSFDSAKLRENLSAFIKAIIAAKPAKAKGVYLKKVSVSSTMGIGIPVLVDNLVRSA